MVGGGRGGTRGEAPARRPGGKRHPPLLHLRHRVAPPARSEFVGNSIRLSRTAPGSRDQSGLRLERSASTQIRVPQRRQTYPPASRENSGAMAREDSSLAYFKTDAQYFTN